VRAPLSMSRRSFLTPSTTARITLRRERSPLAATSTHVGPATSSPSHSCQAKPSVWELTSESTGSRTGVDSRQVKAGPTRAQGPTTSGRSTHSTGSADSRRGFVAGRPSTCLESRNDAAAPTWTLSGSGEASALEFPARLAGAASGLAARARLGARPHLALTAGRLAVLDT